MRDDKIRNALMKITPDEALSRRVDAMVDAADLTPREPAVRRVKRPAKAMLIAAAIVVMMAMAVSAVGVFARLFYLPGAGLVDESGVLVIKEDDIGDLDVVAYKTMESFNLGEYTIESITYTEYEGVHSYTVWSRMSDTQMAKHEAKVQNMETVSIQDHVINDLQIKLSDGTVLAPESTRYNLYGSIVYNYATDKLDTKIEIFSGALGEREAVKLVRVEGAGYSYMQYPTDKGITFILYPTSSNFAEWKMEIVDSSISDGLGEYINSSVINQISNDGLLFYNSSDEVIDTDDIWSMTYRGSDVRIRLQDAPRDGYDIERAELDKITIQYNLKDKHEKRFKMPADGERIDEDIVLFNEAGFDVRLKGYARNGNNITVYVETTPEMESYVDAIAYQVPYSGTNGCTAAFAGIWVDLYKNGSDKVNSRSDRILETISTMSRYVEAENGVYGREYEFGMREDASLDDVDGFTISLGSLYCAFDGNWTVTY